MRVASATRVHRVESRVADATYGFYQRFRGLKPTATISRSLRDKSSGKNKKLKALDTFSFTDSINCRID
jgi:hypothetical protein